MDFTDVIGTRTDTILDDEVANRRVERQADLQGAFSGGGGYCPEGIPAETAILAALAAFGVAFGILFRAVTVTTGGRKKRDTFDNDEPISFMDEIKAIFFSFEVSIFSSCKAFTCAIRYGSV